MNGRIHGWTVLMAVVLPVAGLGCATMDESVLPDAEGPPSAAPAVQGAPPAGSAAAAAPGGGGPRWGPGFVDADGDGLCDRGVARWGKDNTRPRFVDADGDGACDNYQARGAAAGYGRGWGRGYGWGRGRGPGWGRGRGAGWGRGGGAGWGRGWGRGLGRGPAFVDKDGDGVCDRYPGGPASSGTPAQ
jgi:hypothetical protein